MEVLAAVFTSARDADSAAHAIRMIGGCHVNVLHPESTRQELLAVPTTNDMPPVIKYLAATLGAALGLGLGVGLFVVMLDLPLSAGIGAAVVLGILGAILGGFAGRGVDRKSLEGLPEDELFYYGDALRRRRTVVVVRITDPAHTSEVHELLEAARAEAIDPARETLEVGLQSSEKLHYDPPGNHAETLQGRSEESIRP
jgi:hypothetical protein